MNKKWAYFLAVVFLAVIRFGVLNTSYDAWLLSLGYEGTANFISLLKASPAFQNYFGSWALLVFVVAVIFFWCINEDDGAIPQHFLLLPIVYVPFSIVGTVLSTAEFHLNYLWVQPLVILPFGYLYVAFWRFLLWIFEKLRLVS